jgi:hypothetical protein
MQRRATEVSSRRKKLQHKRISLAHERTALARNNQLRRRVHDFAARIHAVIDTLDDTQKQQLLRVQPCSTSPRASPRGIGNRIHCQSMPFGQLLPVR